MRPENVPEELVETADLALSNVCDESVHDECTCPTDEQIRVILAAVIPRVLEQAADVIETEAMGPGHDAIGAHSDAGIFHSALFLRRTGWGIFKLPGEKERLLRSRQIVDEVLGPRPEPGA